MLEAIPGVEAVYYQPPPSVRLKYPAIIYERERLANVHADNNVYGQKKAYQVVVIDRNPDSDIVDKVSKLPRCRFNRHFTQDNLNHDNFTLFF